MKFALFTLLLASLVLNGCSRVPPGFPKTKPCKITVTQDSKPVEGVTVMLAPTEPAGTWTVTGKTNGSGVAAVQTFQGTYAVSGAPPMTYKITLEKQPAVEGEKSPKEIDALGMAGIQEYWSEIERKRAMLPKIIPEMLTERSRTPLSIDLQVDHQLDIELNDYPMDAAEPQKSLVLPGGRKVDTL